MIIKVKAPQISNDLTITVPYNEICCGYERWTQQIIKDESLVSRAKLVNIILNRPRR